MKSIYLRNFTAMSVLTIFCLMLICLSFLGIGRMHLIRVQRDEMIDSAEEVSRKLDARPAPTGGGCGALAGKRFQAHLDGQHAPQLGLQYLDAFLAGQRPVFARDLSEHGHSSVHIAGDR